MWENFISMELAKVPFGMSLILGALILLALLVLWNFHRDKENTIDLKDLVCHKGQINETKFARFTAFVVSTWGFVYLIIDERFSEWYFAGYMAAWAGNALVSKYLSLRDGQNTNTPDPGSKRKNAPTDPPPSVPSF